ncbi:MAG: helix-turn-helix domain-containing protein [Pseudomonadota bacterium]
MNLSQIGKLIRARRSELGLAQEQLGRLAGLSRVTINQLENGTLEDLGYKKLDNILGALGITMETFEKKAYKDALGLAAKTASTSYKEVLTSSELKKILQTGEAPAQFAAHIITLLDEAPTSIVLGAVKEAASDNVSAKKIMKHLAKWASQWQTNRKVWA